VVCKCYKAFCKSVKATDTKQAGEETDWVLKLPVAFIYME